MPTLDDGSGWRQAGIENQSERSNLNDFPTRQVGKKKGSWGEGGGNKAEFGGKGAWRYGREKEMT